MKTVKNSLCLLLFLLLLACQVPESRVVQTGLDNVENYRSLFKDRRVGIISNHSGYNSQGIHIVDVFLQMEDVTVTALFGAEHGFRGRLAAGQEIAAEIDPLSKLPIYSLYGETRKPTPEMLAKVDVLVFDMQDVGARYYTYLYTMSNAMEAAAEQGKSFVVMDRPNPINGLAIEGNVLDTTFLVTFVGKFPIPVRYGMTIGELAQMFNGEGWLAKGVKADLTVIPLLNWRRDMWYDETGLTFIKPSPNMPSLSTATVYPGICLIEGTNLSEGRGTPIPFEVFGAPWVDGRLLAERLNGLNLAGVMFRDTTFTPLSIAGAAPNPKYKDRVCGGVTMKVTDRERFRSYQSGIHVVNTLYQLYPDSLAWNTRHFDRLCGTDKVRETIVNHGNPDSLFQSWENELVDFKKIRSKYLLYERK